MTAFKFLGPAALISAGLDVFDAWTSGKRGSYTLMAAQITSVAGTVFTVIGTGVAVFSIGNSALIAMAAVLGLIGAVLTAAAVIAVLILKEDDWITWLRDNPLSLSRKEKNQYTVIWATRFRNWRMRSLEFRWTKNVCT